MSTTSLLLGEFLLTLGTTRTMLEQKRRQLVDLPSFTSSSVFSLFDIEGKGHITLANIYDYLKFRYVFPSELELFSLFKEIDALKIGVIELDQFTDFLTPQGRVAITSKSRFGHLDSATAAVLIQYFENFRSLEAIKSKLQAQAEPFSYFRLLDSNRNGKVSTLEVRSFMLAYGCLDQNTISNAILETQHRLGCNFDEEAFKAFLCPLTKQGKGSRSIERRCPLSSESQSHSLHITQLKKSESQQATTDTINGFDNVLELRNQENQERRHYLKEQERLRTKIMEDVLSRKRSYLNIRAEVIEDHKQIDDEEAYVRQLEKQELYNERNQLTTTVKQPIMATVSIPSKPVYRPSDRNEVMKRAASEAQMKIEQIETNAKLRAEQRRKLNGSTTIAPNASDIGFQELLLKKNSEIETEKQRRLTLQKELARSKQQILLLKNHLQAINKLNYRESDVSRPTKLLLQQHQGNNPCRESTNDNRTKNIHREAGSIYEANRGLINRRETVSQHKEQTENRHELDQALRRSRVEREFAKFKLEKQFARSRVGWR